MHRLRTSPLPCLVAFALALASPLSASADRGEGEKAGAAEGGGPSAQDLYSGAQKLFDKGSYAEALIAFRQAYNLSGSPNARLMIGQCLIGLGKTADAYEEMAATEREAAEKAASEPKYEATRKAAAAQVSALAPRVAKVSIAVSEPEGVKVTVNGAVVSGARLGAEIAVEPGSVLVLATHADGRTARAERTVGAGESAVIELSLGDRPRKVDSPPPTEVVKRPVVVEPSETGGGVRKAGFAVAAAGAAGMAVFGITGALAQGKFSQLEQECGGLRCTDSRYGEVVDSGKTLSTASTAGLIAGIAGLAGGTAMIVFGGPKRSAPLTPSSTGGSPRSVPVSQAAIAVSPAGAGVRCTVVF
ncbi:MAG: hypothetical protein R3B70_45635 [Polyangiaceae bacterium]